MEELILFGGICNLVISFFILWYTLKPRAITIKEKTGGDRELTKEAIMTPAGVFVVPEKRDPIYNDDESLAEREEEK